MEYMFQPGFLGTRSPFFMDMVTFIVALLPLLAGGAIFLAQRKLHKLHAIAQTVLFVVSLIVVVYFEYGVRVGGGFDFFMKGSSVSANYALFVLLFHIAIALTTLVIWAKTLFQAKKQTAKSHRLYGYITFIGITLTSLTGMWVYLVLFVY